MKIFGHSFCDVNIIQTVYNAFVLFELLAYIVRKYSRLRFDCISATFFKKSIFSKYLYLHNLKGYKVTLDCPIYTGTPKKLENNDGEIHVFYLKIDKFSFAMSQEK